MASTPGKRRRRFMRERRPDLPLDVQDRDRLILKTVHENRFLTSTLIRALIPMEPTPERLRTALATRLAADGIVLGEEPKRGGAALLVRLQRLYQHRFLDRVKIGNNLPICYAIDTRGIDELVMHYGIDRTTLDLRRRNREAGDPFIHHALMLATFRAIVTRAQEITPIRLARWVPEGEVLKDAVYFKEESRNREGERVEVDRRIAINPDAFFVLDHAESQSYYFVEADRSNHTRWRFGVRLKGYLLWIRQGLFAEKFGVTRMPRILTITKSAARRDNLCKLARQVVDRQTKKDADAKAGQTDATEEAFDARWMFWFACERDYNLAQPATLLDAIWRVAVDDKLHRLLER